MLNQINEFHIYRSGITVSRELYKCCIITSKKNGSLFRKRIVNCRDRYSF